MSRTKQLQSRPELPSLDEILSDLESAPNDDVAFIFLRDYASGVAGIFPGSQPVDQKEQKSAECTGELSSLDTSKSFESAAKRPRQDPSKSSSIKKRSEEERRHRKEENELQDTYLKVQKFLEMNSYLRDSQDKITQQCSDLQELGQSVKDQIESLRTQLQS